ncbi:hypothetical protein QVD17_12427 [Tagetes erecta]|uniref:Uncharacterized protein n=1 Tax=Tagetes erecta TaxID=13708 RepID=A0AAD8P2W9_TARER|nr:hypothetical protein QVD17_12427 [Tagetes erecta]
MVGWIAYKEELSSPQWKRRRLVANNRIVRLEREAAGKDDALRVVTDCVSALEKKDKEGFPMVVDIARGSDGFVDAVVALDEAVEVAGRHDGLVQDFGAVKANKIMHEQKFWKPDARAALTA